MRDSDDHHAADREDGARLVLGLEDRVGHGSEKVGEKRRFRDACDTGWGEAAQEGPRGEGSGAVGEKLKDKRQQETKHKQEGFQRKGKGEAVEKRKCPLSERAGTGGKEVGKERERKRQHGWRDR